MHARGRRELIGSYPSREDKAEHWAKERGVVVGLGVLGSASRMGG